MDIDIATNLQTNFAIIIMVLIIRMYVCPKVAINLHVCMVCCCMVPFLCTPDPKNVKFIDANIRTSIIINKQWRYSKV